jgi:hypothetical protein
LWTIEFLAKPRDMHIHGARIDLAIILPDLLENFLASEQAAAISLGLQIT